MIDFFERLDKYMIYKGLNDNKLSKETGISNGLIGKARKRGSLSGQNISKLINTYQDLSADWLFRGEGEMIKVNEKNDNHIEDKDYVIKLQKKTIEALEDKIKRLEKGKK
ncbi:hypothetical protein SAMN05444278_106105 [Psychroflexus salarius]|uniref:Bacteriophage CI repressor helix-turn-helix domain-containing protein n=2 Tax=Psychroflexus salarius TaxID=1155689 RepID=A0A1M4WPZ5_9FLAO|nr:hypothetical protein SAMN05444278_106105 [Psychroflexus salarius]